MNTNKRKKHKGASYCESKSNDGRTEVFVLPPNLLEKLGIKLDNLGSNETLPSPGKFSRDLVDRPLVTSHHEVEEYIETKDLNKSNESSILETASLMKESVLLSPTFVPTVANVIPGEVEIARPYYQAQRFDVIAENAKKTDSLPVEINPTQNYKKLSCNNLESSKKDQTVDVLTIKNANDKITCGHEFPNTKNGVPSENLNNDFISPVGVICDNNKSVTAEIRKQLQKSSLANTEINRENNLVSTNSNYSLDQKDTVPKKKKINVINEEMIDVTKLYRRKSANPNLNNNVLTPVSVDMLLPTAKKRNDVLDLNKTEKIKGSDKVVTLLHDVGRAETDVRPSEKICDVVVNDVVEHVDVLCFKNAANVFETPYDKNIETNELMNVNDNGEVGNSVTEINKVFNDNLSNLERTADNGASLCTNKMIIKKNELHNFSVVVNNTNIVYASSNGDISADSSESERSTDNVPVINNVPNGPFDDGELGDISKLDLCPKSCSDDEILNCYLNTTIEKTPVELEILIETVSEKTEDDKTSICLIDKHESPKCVNSENYCLTGEAYQEMETSLSKIMPSNNIEKEINNSTTKSRKSKLCIQGVEKPGGNVGNQTRSTRGFVVYSNVRKHKPNFTTTKVKKSIDVLSESDHSNKERNESIKNSSVLRTYTRKKASVNETKTHLNHFVLHDSHGTTENMESTVDLNTVYKTRQFCLCQDYGQLKYYDYDNSYEHLHFWNHKDVTSDRDLIFSIYNVDSINECDNVDRTIELTEKSPEETLSKICWNKIFDDINDDKKYVTCTSVNTITNPIPLVFELDVENKKVEVKNEISQAVNNSTFVDIDNNTTGIEAENNLKPKERSDFINNTCINITKPNEDQKALTGNIEKVSEPLVKKKDASVKNMNMTPKKKVKKRTISTTDINCGISTDVEEPHRKKDVKCGVCDQILAKSEWNKHSAKKHGHIAWKAGKTIDFEDKELRAQVRQKLKDDGILRCTFCNVEFQIFKRFIYHVEHCYKEKFVCNNKKTRTRVSSMKRESMNNVVTCGVCKEDVTSSDWIVHICHKHNYIAWKTGETPLNLDDTHMIQKHLCGIIKKHGPLICSNCGFDRKYRIRGVKTYISHIKTCSKEGEISVKEEVEEIVNIEEKVKIEEKVISRNEPIVEQEKIVVEVSIVKCGLCDMEVTESDWFDHIGKEHNYLAWKKGEDSVDLEDKEQVWQHLYAITKKLNGLTCFKCGIKRKYVKKFLSHIKECDGKPSTNESVCDSMNESQLSDFDNSSVKVKNEIIKCGVCWKKFLPSEWLRHIRSRHNYIAWKDGEPSLNIKQEGVIEDHLHKINNEYRSLCCPICGLDFHFEADSVKSYLLHLNTCTELQNPKTVENDNLVKCGVCGKDVKESLWIKHIESKHNYLAWKDGETPLALDDTESIRQYLFTLVNKVEAFKCSKCGVQKKYPKSFITHLENCNAAENDNISESVSSTGICECALCHETVTLKNWNDHSMNNHYNIAWKVGDFPIDLKSNYGTSKYLKEYKLKKGKLVCNKCGISRVSIPGFYAHILSCGKTEEELEEFQNVCEVCNSKYLCIYKNQHMAFHKEQEYAKERKIKSLEMKESEEVQDVPPGRRKAAVKANHVIEKLSSTNENIHTCAACGFETESEKKLARHKCVPATFDESSDSDETDDSEDLKDLDLSEEEEIQDTSKKKKNKESMLQAKVPNVPFKYNEVNSYTAQSKQDFYNVHFTNDTLFPQWLTGEYEILSDDQLSEYLPVMENSCQIKFNNDWETFTRYEAQQFTNGCSIFVGASVQCLSWIPPRLDDDNSSSNYLAVAGHQGSDSPRYNHDELVAHAGLIQIWDFGDFKTEIPKFVLGLVHDYGTIWAMDWCPSGAREINSSGDKKWARLGVLGVACSNGLVYILSVPYPGSIAESGAYVRLKPFAILKLSMSSERKLCQATAINWSKKQGHAIVAVGYANGTTALYDLSNTSPLLQSTDNGVSVIYPYHDVREHNVSIADLDSFPVASEADDVVCSASLSGATAALGAAGRARLHTHGAATGCRFAPGWPSVTIAVDDSIASQAPNELEWYGCARRLGPVRASCGCARCGRVVLYAPPMLRTMRALPPYADLRKQNILGIKAMPLTKKRGRPNDELSMKVEPLTYDEVITQYGVEIFFVEPNDKNNSINTVKEHWTERFPLADVTSMAFCPAESHHEKVAVALHAGFVLVVPV